jgi:transposase
MKHLTQEQRYEISAYLHSGKNKSEIASLVRVHKSTISREIARNSYGSWHQYMPRAAQKKADSRKKCRHRKVVFTQDMKDLAKLSEVGFRTITRFFAGHNIKLDSLEKITRTLGLDLAGNELVSIEELLDKRAEQKALYVVSLVQDTSSLENQGLETGEIGQLLQDTKEQFLSGKYKYSLWKK